MSNYAPYVRFPRRQNQRGGAASDWMHSANSVYIQPGPLTELTKKHIADAPMFHPLEYKTRLPTPTTGIYPVGIYYMNQAAQKQCAAMPGCSQPGKIQRTVQTGREKLTGELKHAMFNVPEGFRPY